ncbi:diacylglycerol kinase family protein [Nocardioides sp. SYSU D00038]|uniref:diacylglycerol/lipid kinase family protein n=1 Tax=Nocardioides sp. SYSU D00038 TaxID=2812554 RepID=UPI001967D20E|nr:diacylglycerol kinase family protein [Nocardioides sp. SYSU D00038]
MSRSFTFLVNPSSGGGAAPEAVVPVARLLREADARVDVTYSPGPVAMAGLVAEAVARGDVVVSVGGDGMLSSLAGLVADAGGTLAVVPAGRGNDFARMLGLPSEPADLGRLLLEGEVRPVDLVAWTPPGGPTRSVAGSVYAGVDARAAAYVHRMRRVPKQLQYPLGALRALATYQPARYRVSVDGDVREHDAATVVVANSGYYGKGMHVAPPATVDDGLLDVIVVEAASRIALMRALPTIYDGSHVHRDEVHVLRGARVEIAATGRTPVEVGGDGEPLGVLPDLSGAPAVAEVRPAVLSVIR